ncbi:MAG: ferritin family protein [Desulfosudaceae bacterium]
MGFDFNIDEILAIAEEIERNGAAFYRTAAEGAPDEATRNTLNELARMEDQHEQTFISLRAELSVDDKKPGAFDPEDETAKYLKALADRRVFHDKAVDLSSLEEVLQEAIQTEEDSIAFYVGMRDLVPPRLGKDKISNIIKEEMGHLVLLTDKLEALQS